MIDLHTHSTFSDGTLTPEELAELGAELGLTALALTDHDTLDGLPRFMSACERLSETPRGAPVAIAGVELSAEVASGTMHILGYGMELDHSELADALERLRQGRDERNALILERLSALGAHVTYDDVLACAGEQVVGRPHFAKALMARGHVSSKDAAFKKLLAKGAPAYVPRFRLAPRECIRLIRAAGGVSALAHPFTVDKRPRKLEACVGELAQLGLQGIEAYYSEHSAEKQAACVRIAKSEGLLMTGGSDFHGEMNRDLHLGCGFGSLRVPDALLPPLLDAMAPAVV